MSHRRLSQRKGLRIALVLLLLFFSVQSEGLFAAMRYLLHHHPCLIQAVFGGYLSPFPSSSSLLW